MPGFFPPLPLISYLPFRIAKDIAMCMPWSALWSDLLLSFPSKVTLENWEWLIWCCDCSLSTSLFMSKNSELCCCCHVKPSVNSERWRLMQFSEKPLWLHWFKAHLVWVDTSCWCCTTLCQRFHCTLAVESETQILPPEARVPSFYVCSTLETCFPPYPVCLCGLNSERLLPLLAPKSLLT